MATATIIEILATLMGLAYVILLIQEKIICWPFGIAGSLLSIYLFIDSKLYSEAILYSYYVAMGAWGWLRWQRRDAAHHNPIVHYAPSAHLLLIVLTSAGALLLGTFFASYSDAQRPYIDAFTTCFSFAATYMEVKKILETWWYWIVINATSIWLYQDRALDIYAALIGLYAVLSVLGLLRWRQAFRAQQLEIGRRNGDHRDSPPAVNPT